MRRLLLVAGLVFSLNMIPVGGGTLMVTQVQAAEVADMAQIRLILKKLRGSMASLKDFDELEAAGMDKADVDRLRKAMKGKIKQMTTDAVELITAL